MTVDAVSTKILNYETLRAKAEKAKDQLEELKKLQDAAEAEVISAILDMQEETGVQDIRVRYDNRNYSVIVKNYYGIPKLNRDAAFEAMRNLGMGELIQEKVDDRTLTKELESVREGNEGKIPDEFGDFMDLLTTYPKSTLRRVKA